MNSSIFHTDMLKLLLHTSHSTSSHRCFSFPATPFSASVSRLRFRSSFSVSVSSQSQLLSICQSQSRRDLSVCAFDSPSSETKDEEEAVGKDDINNQSVKAVDEDYPTGEFNFEPLTGWRGLLVDLKTLVALPWERVRRGSVLTMKLSGQISDEEDGIFSVGLSLPQICENFEKAAYDPRISGVYLHFDGIMICGWGILEEIRRNILNFKQSGKFVVAYVLQCREQEYYVASACDEIYAPPSAYFYLLGLTVEAQFLRGVLDNIGIEPQVERIGKYKSAGEQLVSRTLSEANSEMLTALLDNIYTNWLDQVASARGKKREDVENFINEGVYQADKLKEEGFITNIMYDDEIISMLKERLGVKTDEDLPMVDHRKYSRVRKWTVGMSGGEDSIALIRASGPISVTEGPISVPGSGISAEKFIEKIRTVRASEEYKAAIIRIDSPGGDALASDMMWREIRLLAASKPVIASMSDVAASGGYYMAMAAGVIVAESLTLTGSIGVVSVKPNLAKLYEKIGFTKEIISRGRYAELLRADQRPFRPDEAELFAKFAQDAYKEFRDKAAFSRSMTVEKMEEVAQGRVWTGKDAAERGLVDAIGGLSRAIAIAKSKANIPQDKKVKIEEPSTGVLPSLAGILFDFQRTLAELSRIMKVMLQCLTLSGGVQARMDGVMFERLEGYPYANSILRLIKDYLNSHL